MSKLLRPTAATVLGPAAVALAVVLFPVSAKAQAPAGAQPPAQTERLTAADAARQGMPALSGFVAEMPATMMRLSKVLGTPVIGLDHRAIGKIEEVVLNREGKAEAVVIGAGGVLGMGGKDVAVPYDAVLWNTGDVTRASGPSASLSPSDAPPLPDRNAANRMPGAQVPNDSLKASNDTASADVNAGGPRAATGSTERATAPVVGSRGGPEQAMVRLTKGQLDAAPAFRLDARPER